MKRRINISITAVAALFCIAVCCFNMTMAKADTPVLVGYVNNYPLYLDGAVAEVGDSFKFGAIVVADDKTYTCEKTLFGPDSEIICTVTDFYAENNGEEIIFRGSGQYSVRYSVSDSFGNTTFITCDITVTAASIHFYIPETIPPTYSSEGYTLYTCECGRKYISGFTPIKTFTVKVSDRFVSEDFLAGTPLGVQLMLPTATGYDFYGWYADAEYTQERNYIIESDITEGGEVTLYGKWIARGLNIGVIIAIAAGGTALLVGGMILALKLLKKRGIGGDITE